MSDQRVVVLNGVRTETWKDKKTQRQVTRHIADLYMPGVGGYDALITSEQYALFDGLPSNTQMTQTIHLKIRDEVISKEGGRPFVVRRPEVRFGALSLLEDV